MVMLMMLEKDCQMSIKFKKFISIEHSTLITK
jgi:hypothetical protein